MKSEGSPVRARVSAQIKNMKIIIKIGVVVAIIVFAVIIFTDDNSGVPVVGDTEVKNGEVVVPTDDGTDGIKVVSLGEISKLPLLSGGSHVGMQIGFNAKNTRKTKQSIKDKFKEALDVGMDVDIFHVDWADLEPKKNKYDKGLLRDRLKKSREDGLQPLVFMPAIDSESLVIPEYLRSEGEFGIRDGMGLDDPIVIARYQKLLDWVVPMATEYGAWGIIVGNEADNYLVDFPEKTDEIVNFLIAAREYTHLLNQNMAVAMVVTSAIETDAFYAVRLVNESDFGAFNFYCNDTISGGTSEKEVAARVDKLVKASGSKDIVVQELGCPSGLPDIDSSIKTSNEKQREWFESYFKVMEKTPQIRVAYLFTLVEGDPALKNFYRTIFEEEGLPKDYVNYIIESIGSLGVITYKDGFPKPAWSEFINGIKILRK